MRKKPQWTGYFRFPLNTNERLFLVTWYCQSESLKLGDRGYIYIYIPALTPYVGWVWSWFSLLLREVSPGIPVFPSPQKPTFPNSHSIWNARTRLNEFIWTPKCFVGKQAIYIFFFYTSLIRTPFSVRIRENRLYSASYISSILFNWLLGIINNFGSIFFASLFASET